MTLCFGGEFSFVSSFTQKTSGNPDISEAWRLNVMAHKYYDPFSGKPKSERYYRHQKHKQKMQKLYSEVGDWYPSPVAWSDYELFEWGQPSRPAEGAHLKRLYKTRYAKYCRKVANHKVRHTEDVPQYGGYRKAFEYWWMID
jgi:hypothetical protein